MHTLTIISDHRRLDFQRNTLIFAIKDDVTGWYKTSDCLWSSTANIRGKVTLNDDYEDLKELFVERLGVKTLTFRMVYDELLQTSPHTPIQDVKAALWSLKSLLETETERHDPEPLLKASILLVRYANGVTSLCDIDTDFAIVDRESLAEKFKGKIKLLDFSREEVLRLYPLLSWCGLTNRYLSVVIREITSISRPLSRPISNLNRDIRRKAHAILR